MAKKEKTTKTPETTAAPAAAPTDAAPTAAAAQREMVAQNDRFVFKAELAKGAPQAKAIVGILKAAGDKGLTRKELVEKMNGVVQTRQPLSRILGYYQKDLVNAGAISIVKAEAPAAPVAVAA